MPEPLWSADMGSQRLPLYAFLRPLWEGKRVLEIGSGTADGAALLAVHGASQVVGVDFDAQLVERARARHRHPGLELRAVSSMSALGALADDFDLVLAPDAEALVRQGEFLETLRRLVGTRGRLVIAAPSSDRGGGFFGKGVGFYDLADAVTPLFPHVEMFGQTPFFGFGIVQFEAQTDAIRIDASLLSGRDETPSHYIAIAGPDRPPPLGYALVQVPFAPLESRLRDAGTAVPGALGAHTGASVPRPRGDDTALSREGDVDGLARQLELARGRERAAVAEVATLRSATEAVERRLADVERRERVRADEDEKRILELRQKLGEAVGQGESAIRIARAQGDEIEELRSRLRRAAEDRGAADAEIAKLRRALAEADESVLSLTRRTAEEMSAIAERMTAGLRSAGELSGRRDSAEVASLESRLRTAEEKLRAAAEKASAITERDERIASLETEKQHLAWRVAELEDKLAHAADDVRSHPSTSEEVDVARAARDRAIEDFHRAAAAHVAEVNRLQASLSEQTALVAELEDSLQTAETRAATAEKEMTAFRQGAKQLDEADRARRGRLAELEGKLIRLEREKQAAVAAAAAAAEMQAAATQATTTQSTGTEAPPLAMPTHAGSVSIGASTNGHAAAAVTARAAEMLASVTEIERRLRDEVAVLTEVEEVLTFSRSAVLRSAEEGRHVETKFADHQRELTRVRHDAEAREALLLGELSNLRAEMQAVGESGIQRDQSAQLMVMHTTLTNIRRRAARLRDELEGFRRRLDTLPPGVLSSMLEEIGEDLAEFAK